MPCSYNESVRRSVVICAIAHCKWKSDGPWAIPGFPRGLWTPRTAALYALGCSEEGVANAEVQKSIGYQDARQKGHHEMMPLDSACSNVLFKDYLPGSLEKSMFWPAAGSIMHVSRTHALQQSKCKFINDDNYKRHLFVGWSALPMAIKNMRALQP